MRSPDDLLSGAVENEKERNQMFPLFMKIEKRLISQGI